MLSFSDSTILSFYGITNLSSEKSYVVECSSGIWKKNEHALLEKKNTLELNFTDHKSKWETIWKLKC